MWRRYDGTVRTANGSVVQFLYGEDGMDGTAIEAQKLDALRMPPGKFRVRARLIWQAAPAVGMHRRNQHLLCWQACWCGIAPRGFLAALAFMALSK